MSSVTWACPNCKRRVPNRVSTCHCGTTRAQADQRAATEEAAAKRPAPRTWTPRPRPLPRVVLGRDVKLLLAGIVIIAILAVIRMLMPWQPEAIHPVLGYTAGGPPTTLARPTPAPVGTPRTAGTPPSEVR